MPVIATLKDLTRMREEAQRSLRQQSALGTVITVGMGTCGIAAGAGETFKALQAELARRKMDVALESVGCIGVCAREPLVDIRQAGQPRVTYGNVQPEMVPRLIEEHLVKGQPIREWVIGRLAVE